MKKVYIRTFGCQMNIRDSEFVKGLLLEDGFKNAASFNDADVILFNSCSVRKHAEDRLFSNIAQLKKLKKKKPGLVIGLMGCTAQNYAESILRRSPLIDIACGPGNETDLPKLIKNVLKNKCPVIAADKVNEKRPELFPEYREGIFKAYVSIGEGCNNFCSYCIVPYVRGRERSRSARDIIKEVKGLASRGFKEITLLGQNVNSYKSPDRRDFIGLLEDINEIKGIRRIRFMTSHPKDAKPELFRAMRDLGKVCEHLHLPVQSGSDRILKLMNRRYTAARYMSLAEAYKKIVPDGSLTTDIITGFPSESEKDFKDTLRLMKTVRFDSAFTFKYSPRPPAKSASLSDDVTAASKEKRLKALIGLQSRIAEELNKKIIGKTVELLVDGASHKPDSTLTGRDRTNKVIVFKGKGSLIGKFVNVKIEDATPYALKGRLLN